MTNCSLENRIKFTFLKEKIKFQNVSSFTNQNVVPYICCEAQYYYRGKKFFKVLADFRDIYIPVLYSHILAYFPTREIEPFAKINGKFMYGKPQCLDLVSSKSSQWRIKCFQDLKEKSHRIWPLYFQNITYYIHVPLNYVMY